MEKELVKLDGIFDIQPPVVPALNNLENGLLLFFLIFSISLVFYLLWRSFYSKKAEVKRKIIKLKKSFSENRIDQHDAVYQLCRLLRLGLKLKQIDQHTALPEKILSQQDRWLDFSNNVSLLRYQNEEKLSLKIDLNKLVEESLFWLKVWP